MKNNRIFIVLIVLILTLIVGCSNQTANNNGDTNKNKISQKTHFNEAGNKIVVEKQTNEEDKYEIYNEIKDSKKVQDIKEVLSNIDFTNAIVDMAYPPHYKFHLEDTNKKQKSDEPVYELWISPNKNQIELVLEPYGRYVQLNKEKSQKLFQLLTGKNLNKA